MILAFDTYYFENKAKTVCAAFNNDESDIKFYEDIIESKEDYIPGQFYKKELPCIINLINKIDLIDVNYIIIDGFVFLDDFKKFGLGGFLYEELNKKIPVIGVAKTNFASIEREKRLLFRGKSQKPLYITSIGIDIDEAVKKIETLKGEFRIPTMLKLLDQLTKEK